MEGENIDAKPVAEKDKKPIEEKNLGSKKKAGMHMLKATPETRPVKQRWSYFA